MISKAKITVEATFQNSKTEQTFKIWNKTRISINDYYSLLFFDFLLHIQKLKSILVF